MPIPVVVSSANNNSTSTTTLDVSVTLTSRTNRLLMVKADLYLSGVGTGAVSSVTFAPGTGEEDSFTKAHNAQYQISYTLRGEVWWMVVDNGISAGTYTVRIIYNNTMNNVAATVAEVAHADIGGTPIGQVGGQSWTIGSPYIYITPDEDGSLLFGGTCVLANANVNAGGNSYEITDLPLSGMSHGCQYEPGGGSGVQLTFSSSTTATRNVIIGVEVLGTGSGSIYVGTDGDDDDIGTTWETRLQTLSAAEKMAGPGDNIYVGAGTYREKLTLTNLGSSSAYLNIIGDVLGIYTDGVGGAIRITGSDDDVTKTRDMAIAPNGTYSVYRLFRGLCLDGVTSGGIYLSAGQTGNWIIEDCIFSAFDDYGIFVNIAANTDFIVRRCLFVQTNAGYAISAPSSTPAGTFLIENCVILGNANTSSISVGNGFLLRNNTIIGARFFVVQGTSWTAYNNIIACGDVGLRSTGTPTSDYNCITPSNTTAYDGVTPGSNDIRWLPLFEPPLLKDGFIYPWNPFALSKWSRLRHRTGNNPASEDFFGITRPSNAKHSWGAIQFDPAVYSTGNPQASEGVQMRLKDAGAHTMFQPVNGGLQATISVYAYRGANYAGTLPQMIIREPGQSDRTTTDTGSAENYNFLTDTFTPQVGTEFVIIELRSNNTATSGDYFVDFSGYVPS